MAMDPDAKKLLGIASRYSYIGIFLGVAIGVGYFAGRWLDRRYGTDPWLSMVGLLIGVAAGGRELYRLARQGMKAEQDDSARD